MRPDEFIRRLAQADPQGMQRMIDGLAAEEQRQASRWILNAGLEKPDGGWTMGRLLAAEFPEPRWTIPQYLPVGLAFFAGRPKIGKSYMALGNAIAIACGGNTLGQKVEAGPVLYIALEDNPRRMRSRILQLGGGGDWPIRFVFADEYRERFGLLEDGGGETLAEDLFTYGYRFVVVDTLARCTAKDHSAMEDMAPLLAPLQEIALGAETSVVVVDHHGKVTGKDPDAVRDILGSTAKSAISDVVWGLYKERGKVGARLQIVGRDLEEQTLSLFFDKARGWQNEGEMTAIRLGEQQEEVLDAIRTLQPAGVSMIAKAIKADKGNTYRRLADLFNAGLLRREGTKWALAEGQLNLPQG